MIKNLEEEVHERKCFYFSSPCKNTYELEVHLFILHLLISVTDIDVLRSVIRYLDLEYAFYFPYQKFNVKNYRTVSFSFYFIIFLRKIYLVIFVLHLCLARDSKPYSSLTNKPP